MKKIRNHNSYEAIHWWIKQKYGKATCCENDINHKSWRYEWANISGIYSRDITQYKQLCLSCHRKLDYSDNTRNKLIERSKGNTWRRKSVKQLSLDGKILRTFVSVKEAGEKLNILRTSILNNLSGRTNTCGGYKFRYNSL